MFPCDDLSLFMSCISLLRLNGRFVPPLTTLCLFHARFDDRHYYYPPSSHRPLLLLQVQNPRCLSLSSSDVTSQGHVVLPPSFPSSPTPLPPKIELNLITTPSSPHPPMARPRPPPRRRRRRRHPRPILLLLLLLLLARFPLPTLPSSGPCISDEHPGLATRLKATGLCFTCLLG